MIGKKYIGTFVNGTFIVEVKDIQEGRVYYTILECTHKEYIGRLYGRMKKIFLRVYKPYSRIQEHIEQNYEV